MTHVEVDEVYRRYAPFVLRRCRRMLRDDAAAQDALQEAFLRLWRYGTRLHSAEAELAWLCRVAERCCLDQMARSRSRSETGLDTIADPPCDSRFALELESRQLAMRFLDRFDDRVKTIAVLHYVSEMTHEEIASAIGWSRQTVWKKLLLLRNRARTFVATVKRA